MSDGIPLERFEGGSLTDRVRLALLEAVRSGSFDGGRLPPEDELARQLGISRTTMRAALQGLQEEGLISRRRRHGTFINEHLARMTMRLNRLRSFRELIEEAGFRPTIDLNMHRSRPADGEEAAELEISVGDECVAVERRLRADGRPAVAIEDVIPRTALAVDPADVQSADSTFGFLAANGTEPVAWATSEFFPRVAARGEPSWLEIAPGTPYLMLKEVHFGIGPGPLARSVVEVDDAVIRLSLLRRGV